MRWGKSQKKRERNKMEGKWANPYSIQLTNNTEKRKRSGPSPTVSHTHTHIKRHKSLTKKTKTTQKF